MNVTPPSGVLRLVRSPFSPATPAGETACYVLQGNAAEAVVREIVVDPESGFPGRPAHLDAQPFRLEILHFNDLHGNLACFGQEHYEAVFSRLAGLIRRRRRQLAGEPGAGLLVLGGGDDLVGGLFELLQDDQVTDTPVHAAYRLYTAAGVDAVTLGNHDLDRGLRYLEARQRAEARFPVLSANLIDLDPPGEDFFYPAAILVTRGVRVGLVGLTTPGERIPQKRVDFRLTDQAAAARHILPALRPWCDVLLLLTHLGDSIASSSAVLVGPGDCELAAQLPPGSVDLIVGAHTHQALNEGGLSARNVVNGVPVLQAGAYGRFIGEATLHLAPRPVLTSARLWPVAGLPVDEKFEAQHVRPLSRRLARLAAQELGPVAPEPSLSTPSQRNAFAGGESALGNFVADAMAACCRAAGCPVDFAALDSSALHAGFPPGGTLTLGDLFQAVPFMDQILVCQVDAVQLAALLEDNARRLDPPAEPHVERGFAHFSREIRYTIQGTHAREITLGGEPLDALSGRMYSLALTNLFHHFARPWEEAAGVRPLPWQGFPWQPSGIRLRDGLLAYIREQHGVPAAGGARLDGRLKVVS
ncbi:MAG: 5'-nucleotidase C-terminal domain-containing protein [Anaerolineaceae bacterium]|nr:5'-nucleotidase C-terminal domain-containing protein [Anaerolineaceae bacterium]